MGLSMTSCATQESTCKGSRPLACFLFLLSRSTQSRFSSSVISGNWFHNDVVSHEPLSIGRIVSSFKSRTLISQFSSIFLFWSCYVKRKDRCEIYFHILVGTHSSTKSERRVATWGWYPCRRTFSALILTCARCPSDLLVRRTQLVIIWDSHWLANISNNGRCTGFIFTSPNQDNEITCPQRKKAFYWALAISQPIQIVCRTIMYVIVLISIWTFVNILKAFQFVLFFFSSICQIRIIVTVSI